MTCTICFRDFPAAVCYPCDPAAVEPPPDDAFAVPGLLGTALWDWARRRYDDPDWDKLGDRETQVALAVKRGWSAESKLFNVVAAMKAAEDQAAANEHQAREAREAALQGRHVGVVGERFEWPVLLCKAVVPLGEKVYSGRTVNAVLAKFVSPEGDEVIWFTSEGVKLGPEPDARYTLAATVKEHSDYDGMRQTVITRAVGERLD